MLYVLYILYIYMHLLYIIQVAILSNIAVPILRDVQHTTLLIFCDFSIFGFPVEQRI